MADDYIPVYGSHQYPHMVFYLAENPEMDIAKIIATNLTHWMAGKPELSTLKSVAKASGVGFGTAQRARNGDGNITVQNLELIARAFRRSAIDLITAPEDLYASRVQEPASDVCAFPARRAVDHPAVAEITRLVNGLDELGKGMVLERARMIAEARAEANKVNTASSYQ